MLPPVVVGLLFLAAVLAAIGGLAYFAYNGSKPSNFFSEVVSDQYQLELADAEIDAFFELKEKLQQQFAPESLGDTNDEDEEAPSSSWLVKVPPELRNELKKALMRRILAGIGKMEQVQKDKPGHAKLWQTKLISEKFWDSLCEAESRVNAEIEACLADAEDVEPGWKEQIFPQALHLYRLQKQQQMQREVEKVEQQTKVDTAKDAVKQAEMEKRKEIEEIVRKERAAQKAAEQLLAEEEKAAKSRGTGTSSKAAKTVAAKSKVKKK